MLYLHECAEPTPEPLHSVGEFAAIEESVVEPLHSVDDPFAAEPVQS
jgi:hypothetical protein